MSARTVLVFLLVGIFQFVIVNRVEALGVWIEPAPKGRMAARICVINVNQVPNDKDTEIKWNPFSHRIFIPNEGWRPMNERSCLASHEIVWGRKVHALGRVGYQEQTTRFFKKFGSDSGFNDPSFRNALVYESESYRDRLALGWNRPSFAKDDLWPMRRSKFLTREINASARQFCLAASSNPQGASKSSDDDGSERGNSRAVFIGKASGTSDIDTENGWIIFGGCVAAAVLVPLYAALEGWREKSFASYEDRQRKNHEG